MEEKTMTNSNQFESIVKHLLEVEESIEDLVTSLSSSIEERTELSELMKTYIQGVEDILRNKEQINYAQFPTVIIGCRVRMEEVGSGESVEYRIVSPFSKEYDAGDVSCISPVGKKLLLKKVGDEVLVSVPVGDLHYKVMSICYDQ